MKQPVGVILAGGESRRFDGRDKAFATLNGQSLMHHCSSRFAPQVASWAINSNADRGHFSTFSVPILPDPVDGHVGPLSGVLAGLNWALDCDADSLVTVSVDTPFLPDDLVPRLLMASEKTGLAFAATRSLAGINLKSGGPEGIDRHPTIAIWPVRMRDDLLAWINEGGRKMGAWLDLHHAEAALFPDRTSFLNINTPDDLARAEELCRKH